MRQWIHENRIPHWSAAVPGEAQRWTDSKFKIRHPEGLNSLVRVTKIKVRGYRTFKKLKAIIIMLGKLGHEKVSLPA